MPECTQEAAQPYHRTITTSRQERLQGAVLLTSNQIFKNSTFLKCVCIIELLVVDG